MSMPRTAAQTIKFLRVSHSEASGARHHLIRKLSLTKMKRVEVERIRDICVGLERKDKGGLIQLDLRLNRLAERGEVMERLGGGLMRASCLKELNLSSIGLSAVGMVTSLAKAIAGMSRGYFYN